MIEIPLLEIYNLLFYRINKISGQLGLLADKFK